METRIIPACAGSICYRGRPENQRQDHPRMRGVHAAEDAAEAGKLGSSPHARGPSYCSSVPPVRCRIIPACAGSIKQGYKNIPMQGDHPRMRGVH